MVKKQLLLRLYVGDVEVQVIRMDPDITRVEVEEIEGEEEAPHCTQPSANWCLDRACPVHGEKP